jgi:U6 snRNA-associated Sm-like protein LSm7
MNLVLDDVQEVMRGERTISCEYMHGTLTLIDDEGEIQSRPLGLIVARGTLLVVISPVDGSEEIANPFVQPDEDE